MTPRQARLGVDIFTGAVIASVAIALASLTWRLQGYTGLSAAASPVAPGQATTDVAPIIALAPFGQAAGPAIEGSAEGLQLRAIFAAVPAAASVALIATPDGQVVAYAIGEATPGGIVESIEPEKVTLRTAAGLRVLGFDPAATASANGAAPQTAGPVSTLPVPAPPSFQAGPAGAAAIRAPIPQPAPTPAPLAGSAAAPAAAIAPAPPPAAPPRAARQ